MVLLLVLNMEMKLSEGVGLLGPLMEKLGLRIVFWFVFEVLSE